MVTISGSRPTWDDYFISVMGAVAQRATCNRGRSGCVIVRDKQILVTGYVGSPPGLPHCDDVGHLFVGNHCLRTVHAEQNAICQAAKLGIALEGATLYCRMTPCWSCAMSIISSGITRVVSEFKYRNGRDSLALLEKSCIEFTHINDAVLTY